MKYMMWTVVAALALCGCGGKSGESKGSDGEELVREAKPAGGIVWSYPSAWTKEHDLPMRIATYVIPSYMEDIDPAECAVFYFGKDQGGTVDENINRWGSQFEGVGEATKTPMEAGGMHITVVRISGTYLAPGGPQMQSQGQRPNYKLLGAIVEGPEGLVFFKLTGPASLIEKSDADFHKLMESVRKQ